MRWKVINIHNTCMPFFSRRYLTKQKHVNTLDIFIKLWLIKIAIIKRKHLIEKEIDFLFLLKLHYHATNKYAKKFVFSPLSFAELFLIYPAADKSFKKSRIKHIALSKVFCFNQSQTWANMHKSFFLLREQEF